MAAPWRFSLHRRIAAPHARKPVFSVLTYNVLAQLYADEHSGASAAAAAAAAASAGGIAASSSWSGAFQHVPPPLLSWAHRRASLHQQLATLAADLVCLQEINLDNFHADFAEFCAQQRYSYALQRRKKGRIPVGNAILFHTDVLELDWVETRSRALLASFLSNVWPKRRVYVANVHLQANPAREQCRFQQMRAVLRRLALQQEHDALQQHSAATVICGDFNADARSSVVHMLLHGGLDAGHVDAATGAIVTDTAFTHAYRLQEVEMAMQKALNPVDRRVQPTFVTPTSRSHLDFIFYSTPSLEVVSVLRALDSDDEKDVLVDHVPPNDEFPSDHLPVACVLAWKPQ